MFETLWQYDLLALHKLNVDWATADSDQFWLIITQLHKQPVVIFGLLPILLTWLFYKYRWHAFKPLLFVALAVALSDISCYRGLKSFVNRPRPFQNEEISSWVRKVGDAHGPSFPSNHAANCFAAAGILAFYWRRQRYLFYTLATFVALSRPALGVHYPSDVISGALIGIIIAKMIRAFILNQNYRFSLPVLVSDEDAKSLDWRTRTGRDF